MANHALNANLLSHDHTYKKLSQQHDHLEQKIDKLVHTPSADDTELRQLKRQKLHVRDQMSRLEGATVH